MAQSNNYSCGIRQQSDDDLSCEKVCIFRVSHLIRNDKNKEAYDPSIVSLGPYHKNCTTDKNKLEAVKRMDQHKHEAVKRMAIRIKKKEGPLGEDVDKLEKEIREKEEFLVEEVHKAEKEIRKHYEPINIDGDEKTFSSMMTNDACFILEFFKCAAKERGPEGQICFSRIFQNKGFKNSMHSTILTDIMKLENQVPLCVLITLLQLECDNSRANAITELAAILSNCNLFKKGFPFDGDDVNSKKENENSINSQLKTHIENDARHLLDLYRMVIADRLMLPRSVPDSACLQISSNALSHSNPCAKQFENAGIVFKAGEIKFEKGKLFLPQITVKYRTETLLRNLMAYEECERCSLKPKKAVISDYVCLLDRLVDSEKDVAVLRDSKIIKSFVGSDKVVVDMFNNLAIGITIEPPDDDIVIGSNEFDEVMGKAKAHYDSKWKVLMNEFQQAHFSKPWYTVSLLAATALLVMTIIQTVYSVK